MNAHWPPFAALLVLALTPLVAGMELMTAYGAGEPVEREIIILVTWHLRPRMS
jgi:hypothetical protein